MLGTYQGRSLPGMSLAHGGSEDCDFEVSGAMFRLVVFRYCARRQRRIYEGLMWDLYQGRHAYLYLEHFFSGLEYFHVCLRQ